jgi:hypothetical protein
MVSFTQTKRFQKSCILSFVVLFLFACSKSSENNPPNSGTNPPPADTLSVEGTWILDHVVYENINVTGTPYNDTVYAIHGDSTRFTKDSVFVNSWFHTIANETLHTFTVSQDKEFFGRAAYSKKGDLLIWYESSRADTFYITKLTPTELNTHFNISGNFGFGGLAEYYKK